MHLYDYHNLNPPNHDLEEVGTFSLSAGAFEVVSCAVTVMELAFRFRSCAIYVYHQVLTPPSSWPATLLRKTAAIQGPLVPILSGRP